MYFSKNEMIELNNGNKYLIVDTALLDDNAYYKIEKIENNNHTNNYSFITAINNEGKLYIDFNISPEIESKLKEICY